MYLTTTVSIASVAAYFGATLGMPWLCYVAYGLFGIVLGCEGVAYALIGACCLARMAVEFRECVA